MQLCYVHDPMCSWCWAFRPVMARVLEALPDGIGLRRVNGGLAPDSDEPMPEAMRHALQATWRRIEETVPGTRFDFRFWSENVPRRSTFRACRATIVARERDPALEGPMIEAIQHAYYLQARNPSDADVLADLAEGLGHDRAAFLAALDGAAARAALDGDRAFAAALGARGFPSLFLLVPDASGERASAHPLPIDYLDPAPILDRVALLRAA